MTPAQLLTHSPAVSVVGDIGQLVFGNICSLVRNTYLKHDLNLQYYNCDRTFNMAYQFMNGCFTTNLPLLMLGSVTMNITGQHVCSLI